MFELFRCEGLSEVGYKRILKDLRGLASLKDLHIGFHQYLTPINVALLNINRFTQGTISSLGKTLRTLKSLQALEIDFRW